MEQERKAQLEKELESLQKVKWSFKDIMVYCHCGTATAEKKIKAARALGGGVPGEKAHVFSDVVIDIESEGRTSRKDEIDNRSAELHGVRPGSKDVKEEAHA